MYRQSICHIDISNRAMRQREGSQKTNLEQKYLFSFIRFQRWQIWRYRKNMTASWKSNVHPFKLCHQRGMKTCQLQFYIFSSLPHAQYRSGQARVGAWVKKIAFSFFQGKCIGGISVFETDLWNVCWELCLKKKTMEVVFETIPNVPIDNISNLSTTKAKSWSEVNFDTETRSGKRVKNSRD